MTDFETHARELDNLLDSLVGDELDLPFLTDVVLGRATRLHTALRGAHPEELEHIDRDFVASVLDKAAMYAQAIETTFHAWLTEAFGDA